MKKEQIKTRISEMHDTSIPAMQTGKIVQVNNIGQIFVDFPNNTRGPLVARITNSVRSELFTNGKASGCEVLLAFENNDPLTPIIVGTMYSLIDEIAENSDIVLEEERPQDVILDGKRVVLNAEDEIVLKCGKSSITLTKAGKVIIRGDYVLSRSSGQNQIKGASVSIN